MNIIKGTEHTEEYQPKPDESGLLQKKEIARLIFKTKGLLERLSSDPVEYNKEGFITFGKSTLRELLEAQRDLTASIIRQECAIEKAEFGLSVHEAAICQAESECQQKLKRIKEGFERKLSPPSALHVFGMDFPASRTIGVADLEAIWKEEGI